MRDDCMARDELDARGHKDRPLAYDEIVVNLYNNETFVPVTEALPDMHNTFAQPMELPFAEMPGGKISSDAVKVRMSESRAKLLQVGHLLFGSDLLAM